MTIMSRSDCELIRPAPSEPMPRTAAPRPGAGPCFSANWAATQGRMAAITALRQIGILLSCLRCRQSDPADGARQYENAILCTIGAQDPAGTHSHFLLSELRSTRLARFRARANRQRSRRQSPHQRPTHCETGATPTHARFRRYQSKGRSIADWPRTGKTTAPLRAARTGNPSRASSASAGFAVLARRESNSGRKRSKMRRARCERRAG